MRGLLSLLIFAIALGLFFWGDGTSTWKLSATALREGRIWTLATYALAHSDLNHLLYDALGFLLVGIAVETLESPLFYVTTVLVLVLGLAVFQVVYFPNTSVMGLSGLQQGLFGALIVLLFREGHYYLGSGLAVIQLVKLGGEILGVSSFHHMLRFFSQTETMPIALHAHWISFLAGIILSSLWTRNKKELLCHGI